MLGLGVGFYRLGGEDIASSLFYPKNDDPAGLARWYSANVGISGASGGSSNAGTMADAENITTWVDQMGNANAVQATAADQPHWETHARDYGGLKFDNVCDMTFSAVEIDAEEAFSVVIRIRPLSFGSDDVLIGHDASNYIRYSSNANFRIRLAANPTNNYNFNDGSNTIPTDVYSTFIITRQAGGTGALNIYVKPENVAGEIDWDADETHADTDATSFSILGARGADQSELNAFLKDVLIYKGAALSASQRIDMYSYLESQVY